MTRAGGGERVARPRRPARGAQRRGNPGAGQQVERPGRPRPPGRRAVAALLATAWSGRPGTEKAARLRTASLQARLSCTDKVRAQALRHKKKGGPFRRAFPRGIDQAAITRGGRPGPWRSSPALPALMVWSTAFMERRTLPCSSARARAPRNSSRSRPTAGCGRDCVSHIPARLASLRVLRPHLPKLWVPLGWSGGRMCWGLRAPLDAGRGTSHGRSRRRRTPRSAGG